MAVKQRFWGIVSVAVGLLFGVVCGPVQGQAAKTPSNNIGFSVSAQLPENQRNHDHSFFDLTMQSGQQQTIKVKIVNVTNRDIKIKTGINTAYTNDNGVIEYLAAPKHLDQSLKFQLGKLTKLKGKSIVTVPANGSKIVEAQIEIPKFTFNGTMLGGWFFQKIDEKVTSEVKDAMTVHNQYAYVIGLKYSFGQTPPPKLTLSQVKSGLLNHHQSTIAELRNPTAVIIPKVSLATTISNRSTGKSVKTITKNGVQFAPNSSYHYGLLTGNDSLKAGNYHLRMVAKNSAHRWVLEKDFTITKAAVKQTARKSVESHQLNSLWLVAAGAMAMLIIGGLVAWLVYLVKRRQA